MLRRERAFITEHGIHEASTGRAFGTFSLQRLYTRDKENYNIVTETEGVITSP